MEWIVGVLTVAVVVMACMAHVREAERERDDGQFRREVDTLHRQVYLLNGASGLHKRRKSDTSGAPAGRRKGDKKPKACE